MTLLGVSQSTTILWVVPFYYDSRLPNWLHLTNFSGFPPCLPIPLPWCLGPWSSRPQAKQQTTTTTTNNNIVLLLMTISTCAYEPAGDCVRCRHPTDQSISLVKLCLNESSIYSFYD